MSLTNYSRNCRTTEWFPVNSRGFQPTVPAPADPTLEGLTNAKGAAPPHWTTPPGLIIPAAPFRGLKPTAIHGEPLRGSFPHIAPTRPHRDFGYATFMSA